MTWFLILMWLLVIPAFWFSGYFYARSRFHKQMADGFSSLAEMAATSHTPDAYEVAEAFGLQRFDDRNQS
jgi:hypothetical protein